MLTPGARYAIRRLNYRGTAFDLTFAVEADGLRVELELRDIERMCRVERDGTTVYASRSAAARHEFASRVGNRDQIRLA